MNLLTNPIVVRMAFVLLAGIFAFAVAIVMFRLLRRTLAAEGDVPEEAVSLESMPMNAAAVIQELKQQKHELQTLQQEERRRAKTSENISGAVLAHLSIGVVFVDRNGLVRQANGAARQILGFATPVGMGMAEVFRDAGPAGQNQALVEVLRTCLREEAPSTRVEVQYLTPAGEGRVLDVTITSVRAPSGEALGVACLIDDQTEIARMRRQQELSGEMSAEMALALRGSLATISDSARRLAAGAEPEQAQRLATDIASEAAHLDHTIGGFLAGPRARTAATTS